MPDNKQKKSNEKETAANYILKFYEEIQALNHNYAAYENLILEIENKYSKLSLEKMDDNEKQVLMEAVQNLRHFCIQSYIKYISIISNSKAKKEEEIEQIYKKIKSEMIIKRENIENYVLKMNQFLISNVMSNLLETSQEIIDNIYTE